MRRPNWWPAIPLAAGLTLTLSCTKGPEPPKPGSPAFLWAVATQAHKAGDFAKTNETLEQIVQGKSEFTAKARPWKLLVGTAVAKGYLDLSEKYDLGGKVNRETPMPFRKASQTLRNRARDAAMQSVECLHNFLNSDKEPTVTLAISFPEGDTAEIQQYKKITSGLVLQESETEALWKATLQRQVLLNTIQAAGVPLTAPEKAKALFESGEAKLPRDAFLVTVGRTLFEASNVFDAKKLDEPQRQRVICEEVLKALDGLPKNKETKELTGKVQATLKKIRKT